MYVIFIGPPGAGKGTQAKLLLEYLKVPHLSTGEMLRKAIREKSSLGQLASDYIDRGRLVPDDVMTRLVLGHLDKPACRSGCLMDGFPRTLPQAEALDGYLRDHGRSLGVVLELRVEQSELVRRMLRRAEIEGRSDDTPETIAERMKTFRSETVPLLAYYSQQDVLESIDGRGRVDEVFARIRAAVDRRRRVAAP